MIVDFSISMEQNIYSFRFFFIHLLSTNFLDKQLLLYGALCAMKSVSLYSEFMVINFIRAKQTFMLNCDEIFLLTISFVHKKVFFTFYSVLL